MADKKSIILSEEQLNFIKKASAGKNLLVDASEGCGKTTALIELCDRLPGRKKILFFAVDRPSRNEIEDEIGKRNVTVSYFRGFAFKELKKLMKTTVKTQATRLDLEVFERVGHRPVFGKGVKRMRQIQAS